MIDLLVPGHGKHSVDGMGAVDKHTLYQATKKFFKHTDDVDPYSKLISAEIVRNHTATLRKVSVYW